MQHFTDTHTFTHASNTVRSFLRTGDLFLDIETTGLSRAHHQVYLIGLAAVQEDVTLTVHQLFADDPSEEDTLLGTFTELLQTLAPTRIITFNGSRFDLPFLRDRSAVYGRELTFDSYQLFDIYLEVRKRKQLLQLPGYRQKAIEQFLGISREDRCTGGELIGVYKAYTKQPDADALQLLRLHNYEDVLGMCDLLDIFAYDRCFSSPVHIKASCVKTYKDPDGIDQSELIVELQAPCALPGVLSARHPVSDVYVHAQNGHIRVRIPLYHGMARLYYLDYKNYYYLPAEDMAVHKSVAAVVDAAYKQKATPETCYTRVAVTDEFLHSAQLAEYLSHVLQSFFPSGFHKKE